MEDLPFTAAAMGLGIYSTILSSGLLISLYSDYRNGRQDHSDLITPGIIGGIIGAGGLYLSGFDFMVYRDCYYNMASKMCIQKPINYALGYLQGLKGQTGQRKTILEEQKYEKASRGKIIPIVLSSLAFTIFSVYGLNEFVDTFCMVPAAGKDAVELSTIGTVLLVGNDLIVFPILSALLARWLQGNPDYAKHSAQELLNCYLERGKADGYARRNVREILQSKFSTLLSDYSHNAGGNLKNVKAIYDETGEVADFKKISFFDTLKTIFFQSNLWQQSVQNVQLKYNNNNKKEVKQFPKLSTFLTNRSNIVQRAALEI